MKQNKDLDILIEYIFQHISAELRHALKKTPTEDIIDVWEDIHNLPNEEWALFGTRFTSLYCVVKSVESYIKKYADETTKHDFEVLKNINEYFKECASMGLKHKEKEKSHE